MCTYIGWARGGAGCGRGSEWRAQRYTPLTPQFNAGRIYIYIHIHIYVYIHIYIYVMFHENRVLVFRRRARREQSERVSRLLCWKWLTPRPESRLDWRRCSEFARPRLERDMEQGLIAPLSSKYSTHKTAKAIFRPWFAGATPLKIHCSLFTWKQWRQCPPSGSYFFFFFLITLKPRDEWYKRLWASNASPPRNRCTFM